MEHVLSNRTDRGIWLEPHAAQFDLMDTGAGAGGEPLDAPNAPKPKALRKYLYVPFKVHAPAHIIK
jgi:hypothetical protein